MHCAACDKEIEFRFIERETISGITYKETEMLCIKCGGTAPLAPPEKMYDTIQ